ncbi:MAG: patatin family protein [Bacillus sp. (in: Bacteria)]|nr:patatin family protein [Bacillus sp. (in: firmicutes)]MCM1425052.1 patatin family protein [Eubacterium sp.]
MYQAGLILEGGAMKGVYTAGVLDFFLDKEIDFSSCYGVSAGACCLCSYLSKQRGRAYHVNVDYLGQKAYCSVESLLKTGDLFGVDMCYNLIPEYLDPYDYDTFSRYQGNAYAVVTNIRTGEPEYMLLKDMHKDTIAVRASSSMPLVSRNVKIDGNLYLDGGISDSIPIRRSMKDGNRKNVVIMTKEEGYIRQPAGAELALVKARYIRYPKVYELMKERHLSYNNTVQYIEEMRKRGEVFVIRPKQKSDVGRVEKDKVKLDALYEEGYRDAKDCYLELLEYLS